MNFLLCWLILKANSENLVSAHLFERLNKEQRQAVETTEGRLLILAGAGSGKTSVLMARIIHLIETKKARPSEILGLTFTAKAAEEMRHRIASHLSAKDASAITLATFHSFCYKLLRQHIQHLGYLPSFTIYQERDMKRLIERWVRHEMEHEGEMPSLSIVFDLLTQLKAKGSVEKSAFKRNKWLEEMLYKLKESLPGILKAYNALDYDGLLESTVELLKACPPLLQELSGRYRYIMIDEYQDTSKVQDELSHLLATVHGNLCVVGDDDQSIYSWRGVNVRQILDFPRDIMVKLENNYRSTQTILDAANHVIAFNTERFEKVLKSQKTESHPIDIFHAPNEAAEAKAIADRIIKLRQDHSLQWHQIAVLYRSNHLAQSLELAFLEAPYQDNGDWVRGIPYQVADGTELLERSEIQDVVAFLRCAINPKDEEAWLRLLTFMPKQISPEQLKKITLHQRKEGLSLETILSKVANNQDHLELSSHSQKAAKRTLDLLGECRELFTNKDLETALLESFAKIDYQGFLKKEAKSEQVQKFKWENILSFIKILGNRSREMELSHPEDILNLTLLDTKKFTNKNDGNTNKVQFLTFHSSKGLEFEAVFLIALEDHIIPHEKSEGAKSVEEERRLFYVALTRAKSFLTLSMARQRSIRGKPQPTNPSRFLTEIPSDLLSPSLWNR